MALRPSAVWKEMPTETRVRAAEAFWRDDESPDIGVQQAEAVVLLAGRLHFRPKSLQAESVERRARQLAHVLDVSDAIATRALIAYHFRDQRPLMSAFLDAAGIAHTDGLITAEHLTRLPAATLAAAVAVVKSSFAPTDVDLYLRTLAALDPDTWGELEASLGTVG